MDYNLRVSGFAVTMFMLVMARNHDIDTHIHTHMHSTEIGGESMGMWNQCSRSSLRHNVSEYENTWVVKRDRELESDRHTIARLPSSDSEVMTWVPGVDANEMLILRAAILVVTHADKHF